MIHHRRAADLINRDVSRESRKKLGAFNGPLNKSVDREAGRIREIYRYSVTRFGSRLNKEVGGDKNAFH